jgi:hypothetical protein
MSRVNHWIRIVDGGAVLDGWTTYVTVRRRFRRYRL